ncbi:hypothetical protein [Candidatus Hecatella orcuttiae]|jgi:hypothetical protein|uniref:hypothetical protein n=1 Tax=Candidatus Hecatella orcuttiae TaxID=1935119 RepID=UPI0028682868|nr:hypothetical protein [Candidatus Hecatella orcuttiae]
MGNFGGWGLSSLILAAVAAVLYFMRILGRPVFALEFEAGIFYIPAALSTLILLRHWIRSLKVSPEKGG